MHRRDFLVSLLGAAASRAAWARAQSADAGERLFDIEKTAEGVYLAAARPAALLNCNAAVFVNARDILVVDAHSKPSAAAALVAQIRREVSPKPVRYIVNTHFHWDHTQGMAAYRRLAPQAGVLASTTTRRLLAEHGAKRLAASLDSLRQNLEGMKQKLASARAAAEKSYYQRMVTGIADYIREMQDYAPELPDITFDDHLVIHDPAHELHLVFRGRAHTASDVCVFCPQKRALATGDLLHGFVPGMGDGYPLEWPTTLGRLGELDFTHVLPGHGALQHGRERLRQMTAYLNELNERVAAGKRAGRSVEEMQAALTPATLRSLDPNGYGGYIEATLDKFTLRAPEVSAAAAMAAAVKANVAESYRAV